MSRKANVSMTGLPGNWPDTLVRRLSKLVLLGHVERLRSAGTGLHVAPPCVDALAAGMRVALILDDGIGHEGVEQSLTIVALVRVEIGLNR